MTYNKARKLHKGDKVIVKAYNKIVTTLNIFEQPMNVKMGYKVVHIECDDGNTYCHLDVKNI